MNQKYPKPVIGVTGDYRPARYNAQELSWFNSGYYDSVLGAGGLPYLLAPMENEQDLRQAMEMLGGIVVAGSNLDIDTTRLGMRPSPAVRPMPERRENFDRRVIEIAVEMKVPVLAVGAGMQLVNVLCGGSVFQHIPDDLPRALHHRDEVEKNLRHILEVVPGTHLDSIYGPGEVRVNSHHHMAVNDLSGRFRVSATCPDGVIEAYESIDPAWWCLGVQWHPEDARASALDIQLFEALVEAAGRYQNVDVVPMSSVMRRAAA